MYAALYRLGIGAYLLWLLLTVLLILGRYTPVPSFRVVHIGVVAGAAVLTLIGATRLLRKGYGRVTRLLNERS
ncbi:hypothetical protein DVK05_07210 [Halorubrum sp. Atlit-8R]|uniref:hypothetical protein n=1 Tax=unclassified Halorubrum TaxID=2642239 RepID=UPI000EF251DE|nr:MULTISPECIES: hypothetical protein [unclassified Halorubrum]RLM67012.1 hypothetical protein DVK08_14230 [Halorubrum sp. Atlit-9R]RLM81836.1 hypothetical protein DVK05_07210 [Halorubrum sp. Atlit-8R]